ncbi:GNAT family N-acetyltransferase [Aestuariibius sp. HNIBRBA575]|uniref:GNAT family N-acetyltransferase n=1 Tax=Aestuariibius sp. HNIBRBA575 TaxID=3233343 RepID=UPI0034A2E336
MILIEPGNPRDPQTTALLKQSHALMQSLFPADACLFLPIDALCADHIRFFVARQGQTQLGTCAIALKDGYAEVKSMFTTPDARGKGVGAALIRQIEDAARAENITMLKLETGTGLDAAHRLYERFGFTYCDPFGDYEASEFSVFMEKTL